MTTKPRDELMYRIKVPAKGENGESVGYGYIAWSGFALPPPWQPVVPYAGVYDTTGVRLAGVPLAAPVVMTAHGAVTIPKPTTADELDALNTILKAVHRFEPEARLVLVRVRSVRRKKAKESVVGNVAFDKDFLREHLPAVEP